MGRFHSLGIGLQHDTKLGLSPTAVKLCCRFKYQMFPQGLWAGVRN